MTVMLPAEYMTSAEAARELKVSSGRIRQLIASGILRSGKLGNMRWIERASVYEYKKNRKPAGWQAGNKRTPRSGG